MGQEQTKIRYYDGSEYTGQVDEKENNMERGGLFMLMKMCCQAYFVRDNA